MSDRQADGYQPYHYDDPSSASLWSTYLSKSEKRDKAMAQNWKGDMDAILIFAGLFSASVTAFIIESYKTLNPDPTNTSILILSQISNQLASMSNGTSFVEVSSDLNQPNFSPPLSAWICNTLWFLSLGFSLICALSATLVEQWTRQYLQATNSKPAPQDRARLCAYLHHGIKKYKMAAIVETIPMLLHISLFLFFAGLVAFLVPINAALAYVIAAMLFCCGVLYLLISIIPVFHLACPYWTPLSTLFWAILRSLRLLHRRDADGNIVVIDSRMTEARETDAIDITPERDQRDLKAMCWTINALRKDNEFEPFVEVIPSVVSGIDYSAKWLLDVLMNHDDISIKLGYRIPGLLASSRPLLLGTEVAQKRAIICLKSIWSLTMLSIPKPGSANLQSTSFRQDLKFKEDTLDLLFRVQKVVPAVDDYILSVSIVVARSLMDMQADRALALEQELLHILETGQPLVESFKSEEEAYHVPLPDKGTADLIEASKQRMQLLVDYMVQSKKLTVPLPHVMLEAVALHQMRLLSAATNSMFGIDMQLIRESLELLRTFQTVLNQAGFNLALEYIAGILNSDTSPHEVYNTLRRVFFRINFQTTMSKESQERLVYYLEEGVEQTATWSTRLPKGIIEILLSLTKTLTEPNLVLKAIGIIAKYVKTVPDDAARDALVNLEYSLPGEAHICPPLDLFSSHIFTDAKPSRKQTRPRANTSLSGFPAA